MKLLYINLLCLILCGCAQINANRGYNCLAISSTQIKCEDIVIDIPGVIPDSKFEHTVLAASVLGQCYYLAPGLWVENEGDHIDIYNNSACAHGPYPKRVICNDLDAEHLCWIEQTMYSVESKYSDMKVHGFKIVQ